MAYDFLLIFPKAPTGHKFHGDGEMYSKGIAEGEWMEEKALLKECRGFP